MKTLCLNMTLDCWVPHLNLKWIVLTITVQLKRNIRKTPICCGRIQYIGELTALSQGPDVVFHIQRTASKPLFPPNAGALPLSRKRHSVLYPIHSHFQPFRTPPPALPTRSPLLLTVSCTSYPPSSPAPTVQGPDQYLA